MKTPQSRGSSRCSFKKVGVRIKKQRVHQLWEVMRVCGVDGGRVSEGPISPGRVVGGGLGGGGRVPLQTQATGVYIIPGHDDDLYPFLRTLYVQPCLRQSCRDRFSTTLLNLFTRHEFLSLRYWIFNPSICANLYIIQVLSSTVSVL